MIVTKYRSLPIHRGGWNPLLVFWKKRLRTKLKTIYEAFHVNSPSVAQNSAVFGSCSN